VKQFSDDVQIRFAYFNLVGHPKRARAPSNNIASIAEALLLSEDAIREHIAEYKESKKLKPENGGSTQKLSIEHSNELVAHLRNRTYLYVKDIIAYVQSTWSVTYSVPGMRNCLQRYGFSYKKPALVPGKADGQKRRVRDKFSPVNLSEQVFA
jgi:transposase